jgi:hypothetical protein
LVEGFWDGKHHVLPDDLHTARNLLVTATITATAAGSVEVGVAYSGDSNNLESSGRGIPTIT